VWILEHTFAAVVACHVFEQRAMIAGALSVLQIAYRDGATDGFALPGQAIVSCELDDGAERVRSM